MPGFRIRDLSPMADDVTLLAARMYRSLKACRQEQQKERTHMTTPAKSPAKKTAELDTEAEQNLRGAIAFGQALAERDLLPLKIACAMRAASPLAKTAQPDPVVPEGLVFDPQRAVDSLPPVYDPNAAMAAIMTMAQHPDFFRPTTSSVLQGSPTSIGGEQTTEGSSAPENPFGAERSSPELKGKTTTAAVLSTERRIDMPKKEFALPKEKKPGEPGEGAYPIPDKRHAANALSRVSQFGSPAEKAQVRAKVHAKYPDMGEEKKSELGGMYVKIAESLPEHMRADFMKIAEQVNERSVRATAAVVAALRGQ